jgi:hypothetical protein
MIVPKKAEEKYDRIGKVLGALVFALMVLSVGLLLSLIIL